MKDVTYTTQETATLGDIGGPLIESPNPETLEAAIATITAMRKEIEELEAESVDTDREYKQEVADHQVTASKVAAAERALITVWKILRDDFMFLDMNGGGFDQSIPDEKFADELIGDAMEHAAIAKKFAAEQTARAITRAQIAETTRLAIEARKAAEESTN